MFSLFFDFTPYIAVIGDIFESQKIKDRNSVQIKLNSVLSEINKIYSQDIASKLMITLGDEFQGLLHSGTHVMEIMEKIESAIFPVTLRFGIGVGRITTDIDPDLPLGADGPAYYNARRMIDEIKAAEKKKMGIKLNKKIEIESYADLSELINTIFSLCSVIKTKWTDRQQEIINAYLACKGTQSDAAYKLGIDQSNIQKALASSNFYTYHRSLETITKILSGIKEGKDV